MEICKNNYLQEVDIYFINLVKNGHRAQKERDQMLFELYPDITKAYNLNQQLRGNLQ